MTKLYPTLMDALQGSSAKMEAKILDSVKYAAPLFNKIATKVIDGTSYNHRIRTSLPLIGARPVNAGVGTLSADYKTTNAQCFHYEGHVVVDKAIADVTPSDGIDLMAENKKAAMKGAEIVLERSLIYGKEVSPFGMDGLVDSIADYHTISATGSEASRVHSGASVWALNINHDMMRVIFGGSKAMNFTPVEARNVPALQADGKTWGEMRALVSTLMFWIGFDQMDEDASFRLVNESDTNPLTDSMLARLVELFPSGTAPNLLVMHRSTGSRLRASRTSSLKYVKKTSGNTTIADAPADFDGIPIIYTDALLPNETLENIAKLKGQTKLVMEKNTNLLKR